MTRIAIVSDVHGSLRALDAVINDLQQHAPDIVVHGGDLVLNGPRPAQVVDRIRELGWSGIVGNTDELLWNPSRRAEQEEKAPKLKPLLAMLFEESGPATLEMLGERRLQWLKSLPQQWRYDQLLLVHARPGDLWSAPPADATDLVLDQTYGRAAAAVVIHGHIHRPYVRRLTTGLTVANSGSAGLSYDGDPRASYLLFEDEDAVPEIRRVEYDVAAELRDLASSGYPNHEWLAEIKKTGRFHPVPSPTA